MIADKGYNTSVILAMAVERNMKVAIPPKNNRPVQREYDKYLYEMIHLVENAFLQIKEWRGISNSLCEKYRIIPRCC